MEKEFIVSRYPYMWHMAYYENLEGILRYGLLSTSSLLDLYEYSGSTRSLIESSLRSQKVIITHHSITESIIRDQKPMTLNGVEGSIEDCTAGEYFRFLNGRVFFWMSEKRLKTMNGARAYRSSENLVFVVNTASLIEEYNGQILLSPMNSGATLPRAYPRSIGMFKSIEKYSFKQNEKK